MLNTSPKDMGNRTLPLKPVSPNQSIKQKPTQPKPTQQKPTQKKPIAKKQSGFRLLLHLLQRHPLLSLVVVWGSIIYFGWLAISGLTYTNPAPLEVVESPQPAVSQPVEMDKPATSLGMLAIVAVSCAAGSVMLARQLRPAKPEPRRGVKQVPPPDKVRSRPPRPLNSKLKPQPTQPSARKSTPIAARPPVRPPIVTLLSVENEEPLEQGDVTLAEMMDIRRQA
jgi:hypothetical protein